MIIYTMLGIFKSTYCSAAKPQVRYPTRTCRLDRRPLPVAFPLLGEHEPRQVWHSLKPQGLKACLPWHTRILSQKNSESHASPPFRYVYCVKNTSQKRWPPPRHLHRETTGATRCIYGSSAMWRHSVTSRKLPCVAPIVLMTLFTGRVGQTSRVTTSRSSTAKRKHQLRHISVK